MGVWCKNKYLRDGRWTSAGATRKLGLNLLLTSRKLLSSHYTSTFIFSALNYLGQYKIHALIKIKISSNTTKKN